MSNALSVIVSIELKLNGGVDGLLIKRPTVRYSAPTKSIFSA